MDDAASMGGVECVGDVGSKLERRVGGQWSARQACRERFALDVLHDDEVPTRLVMANLVDRADQRMIERGHRAGFIQEPMTGVIVERGVQELDGDLTAKVEVVGQINIAHAAGTKLADKLVMRNPGPGHGMHGATTAL
jgi:hypothetical protein